jgi:signal transduction histidine kinase
VHAYAEAALGYVCLATLVLGQWAGWIPLLTPHGAVNATDPLDGRYVLTILVVYGLLLTLAVLMLTSLMDIIRQGERQLAENNETLRRLSAMRRDFLHIAIHDLKSPVVAVLQHIYNLEARLREPGFEQEARWLDRCRVRLEAQLEFLRDLQTMATLEAGEIEKQMQPVDMDQLLSDLVEENTDLARARNQTLQASLPDALPAVRGIERLLREAVLNLITNALKYTPDGGAVTVRARPVDRAVRVEVQDTGIGIAPADRDKLFREFSRLARKDAPARSAENSSGLGLAIVKRIADIHGGTVGVDSEVNRGSTFYMEFPAARGAKGRYAAPSGRAAS